MQEAMASGVHFLLNQNLASQKQLGDPYHAIGVDESGRTAIDFGVYGVPETYVIRPNGTIAYRFVGPLSEESLRQVLLPQIIAAAR